jgi:hypothetical protein
MRNRITRREVILTNGTTSYLVGYTPQLSRTGLRDAAVKVGSAIVAVAGLPDSAIATWPNVRTWDLGHGGWIVTFSGRTQIDAQDHGELPFVAELS